MGMGRFRSFRNPVSKRGATSNTTGSRIRSSARTLREKSASLVQQARSKVKSSSPVQGYQHATAQRKVAGSAAAAGETARKRAYHATKIDTERRQATYQGIKNAPAPSGSGFGYRAGYRIGAKVAASKYKSNVATQNSRISQPTHMQPKGLIQTKPTGLENAFERGLGAVQRGSRVAAVTANRKIGRATRRVQELKGIAKQGFDAGKNPYFNQYGALLATSETYQMNRAMGARRLDAATITGGFGAGRVKVKAQNAASQVRSASQTAVSKARSAAQSLKSNIASAKSQAGGMYRQTKLKARIKAISAGRSISDAYKSVRREADAIQSSLSYGVKSGMKMPDASVRRAYEAQRVFNSKAGSGSFAAAYGVGKSLNRAGKFASKASSSISSAVAKVPRMTGDAIVNTVEGVHRALGPAALKIGQANLNAWSSVGRAAKAAYREVYTAPRQSYAKKMFDARNMQVHAEYAAEMRAAQDKIRYAKNARMIKSTRIGHNKTGLTTTRWGDRDSVTPTGRNAVAQQVRYQNFMDRRAASRSTGKAKPTSINTSQNLSKFNANLVSSLRQQQQQRTSSVSSTTVTPVAPKSNIQPQPQPQPQGQGQDAFERRQKARSLALKRRSAREAREELKSGNLSQQDTERNTEYLGRYSEIVSGIRSRNKSSYKHGSNSPVNRVRQADPGLKAYWDMFEQDRMHKQNSSTQASGAKAAYTDSQQSATATVNAVRQKRQPKKPFTHPVAISVMDRLGVEPTAEERMAYMTKESVLEYPSGMENKKGAKPKPNSKAWKAKVDNIVAFSQNKSREKQANMPASWKARRRGNRL